MHQTFTKLIQCINVWDRFDRPPVGIQFIKLLVHPHTRVLLLMHSDWLVASDVISATAHASRNGLTLGSPRCIIILYIIYVI